MKKSTILGLLVVILCCAGLYQIMRMPPVLSNAFRGTYGYDEEASGAVALNMYMSVDDRDFHVFHERSGLFLYGTYEKVGDNQYRMKGKHIEEQIVAFDDKARKFTFKLNGGEIPFVKISDPTLEISDSLAKAKANDRKTAAQLDFLPDYGLYGGTYGYVDAEGNLSKEQPYRFTVDEGKGVFWLYNEKTGYFMEGESEYVSPHSHYILSGEGIEKQHIYPQESGIVVELNGEDRVFVKLDNEIILPDSDPDKKIQ